MTTRPRLAVRSGCQPCHDALDRLEWSATATGVWFGVRVGVRADDPSLLAKLRALWPPDWQEASLTEVDRLYTMCAGGRVDGTAIRRFSLAYSGVDQIARTLDETELLGRVQSAIELDIATDSTAFAFVHAGVVAYGGRAIVIPAPSGDGKSSLVSALVDRGAAYLSDDMAAIDEHGNVHSFARPLALRQPLGGLLRIPASDVGGSPARPFRIGLVVSTRFDPDAVWQPQTGSDGEAVMSLFANAVRARLAPAATLAVLARAVTGARLLQGPRGDASLAADAILRAL